MKIFVYIVIAIILFSFGYNLYYLDLSDGFFSKENLPYVIGTAAGICGLILCVIYFRYARLKENLDKRVKQS